MPTVNIVADTTWASPYGQNSDYSTARSTSSGAPWDASNWYLGQQFSSPNYRLFRMGLRFNLSALPVGAMVSQAYITMTLTGDLSGADFSVNINQLSWNGLTTEQLYDGCLAASLDVVWRSTSGIATGTQYNSPDLNTARVAAALGGMAYYGLISSRDVAGNTPSGDEYIVLATPAHGTPAYRPSITITYSLSTGFMFF